MFSEKTIINGEGNFVEVTHLKLKGSNFKIGQYLATLAYKRHQVVKIPWTDPVMIKNQIKFMKEIYPIHYKRMKGAARAYNVNLEENTNLDFSGLYYYMGVPGCTAVYYPPHTTNKNDGILSRNFDFTTGTIMGVPPKGNEMATVSRPYIIETYPDKGYNSLYVCSFELLGGVLDGINSEGLTVAILADDETGYTNPPEGILGSGVGVSELLIMRMLLDNCKNVEEAKECLLKTKQYYFFAPLHYIIADRFGNSFVYEHSYTMNKEFIINGENKPQVVTNFLLHRYPAIENLPKDEERGGRMYKRYRIVSDEINKQEQPLSLEKIKEINSKVFWDVGLHSKTEVPPRTLWHSIYNTNERSLEISFYLRDEIVNDEKKMVRSDYFKFKLD